jgi:hypothetical protein
LYNINSFLQLIINILFVCFLWYKAPTKPYGELMPEACLSENSRLETLLLIWAEWMYSGGSVHRGYPTRSIGFTSVGVTSFDDAEDEADIALARSIDAVIEDLPLQQKKALHHCYLGSGYRYSILSYGEQLGLAKRQVEIGMGKKGIW